MKALHTTPIRMTLVFFLSLTAAACAPQSFDGSTTKTASLESPDNTDALPDDEVPEPQIPVDPGPGPGPGPVTDVPAKNFLDSNTCALTSIWFEDDHANFDFHETVQACKDYGLTFHQKYQGMYSIQVRFIPKEQMRSIIIAVTGVADPQPTTPISIPALVKAIKEQTSLTEFYDSEFFPGEG